MQLRLPMLFFGLALSAGCSFDAGGASLGADGGGPPGADARATSDGPPAPPDAATAPAPCPASINLVACYRFELAEHPGQPYDESSYGNFGTSSGLEPVAGRTGAGGQAAHFDDQTTTLVPDSASLDVAAVTIDLWLYVDELPPANGRAGLIDNNGEYGLFLAPDGTVRCSMGSVTDIGLTVAPGVWTHLACTYDGQAIRLYQDGQAGPTTASTLGISTGNTDGTTLGQNSPSGDHLHGALDDVHVWNVALPPSQIFR